MNRDEIMMDLIGIVYRELINFHVIPVPVGSSRIASSHDLAMDIRDRMRNQKYFRTTTSEILILSLNVYGLWKPRSIRARNFIIMNDLSEMIHDTIMSCPKVDLEGSSSHRRSSQARWLWMKARHESHRERGDAICESLDVYRSWREKIIES